MPRGLELKTGEIMARRRRPNEYEEARTVIDLKLLRPHPATSSGA
ncbi:MAG TPA: hypothetical protein PLN78_03355 [Pseudomonadales bacterium]|nr:hypothetical protein [Pseudomonadales bacterium]